MASPAGCSGYRCESPPCTEPCPTSVVPVHRPHLSTAWLPSVHPPGRPGRRGRSARGAAASGLTERSDCRHHASHVATLCHRLVRRRLNTLLPPDLPKSLPQLLTETLSSKDPRSHPSSPIPPSTPPARHLSLFELVAEREDGPIESVAWRPRPGSELPNTTCGGSSLHEGSVRRRGGRLRKEPDSPRGAGPEARDVAHGAGRTTVLAGGAPARGADRNVAQSASSLEDEFGPIRELRPGRTTAYSHSAPARAPRAPSVYGPAASAIA